MRDSVIVGFGSALVEVSKGTLEEFIELIEPFAETNELARYLQRQLKRYDYWAERGVDPFRLDGEWNLPRDKHARDDD
jgi:hypothetical protein